MFPRYIHKSILLYLVPIAHPTWSSISIFTSIHIGHSFPRPTLPPSSWTRSAHRIPGISPTSLSIRQAYRSSRFWVNLAMVPERQPLHSAEIPPQSTRQPRPLSEPLPSLHHHLASANPFACPTARALVITWPCIRISWIMQTLPKWTPIWSPSGSSSMPNASARRSTLCAASCSLRAFSTLH